MTLGQPLPRVAVSADDHCKLDASSGIVRAHAARTIAARTGSIQDEDVQRMELIRSEPLRQRDAELRHGAKVAPPVDRLAIADTRPARARSPVTTFAAGERIAGRYEILRFVARGGMGEVYEARDELIGERVALKTARRGSTARAARLANEVRVARRVSHHNVCRVYDLGRARNPGAAGVSYLTMEFVVGQSLGSRLARGALPYDVACTVACSLLEGLGAVHRARIIHRDLKSENIMLREGLASDVVLMDFGLARPFGEAPEPSTKNPAQLSGTLSYMAPEQLLGEEETFATDVFAFGMVFYEMLTGTLPFGARSGSPLSSAMRRLTEAPEPVGALCPEIPAELDAFVLSCLARDPQARPATAQGALEQLALCIAGSARP